MKVVRDASQLFTASLAIVWLGAVALPIVLSMRLEQPLGGLPLVGVVLWFGLLRLARWLSPPQRADALARHDRYQEALTLADASLRLTGRGAWRGTRRLIWLNRRTAILLALGRLDEALTSALEAMDLHADPETLASCALALLRLNRYDEAAHAARLALTLTRERSVLGHAVLGSVMLARGMPAEAEALAKAGITDARTLMSLAHPDHYALCLATLARAERALGRKQDAQAHLADLLKGAHRSALIRAMALAEQADSCLDTEESRARAVALLLETRQLAPDYALWFVAQPGTLAALHDDARLAPIYTASALTRARANEAAPSVDFVEVALAEAERSGQARIAPQSSRAALLMQVLTLGGTFLLLLLWTWHFFLVMA